MFGAGIENEIRPSDAEHDGHQSERHVEQKFEGQERIAATQALLPEFAQVRFTGLSQGRHRLRQIEGDVRGGHVQGQSDARDLVVEQTSVLQRPSRGQHGHRGCVAHVLGRLAIGHVARKVDLGRGHGTTERQIGRVGNSVTWHQGRAPLAQGLPGRIEIAKAAVKAKAGDDDGGRSVERSVGHSTNLVLRVRVSRNCWRDASRAASSMRRTMKSSVASVMSLPSRRTTPRTRAESS